MLFTIVPNFLDSIITDWYIQEKKNVICAATQDGMRFHTEQMEVHTWMIRTRASTSSRLEECLNPVDETRPRPFLCFCSRVFCRMNRQENVSQPVADDIDDVDELERER